ncbi:MAG: AraC family transcriptional regulator [Muribaculaceae bacterium]|jgi:AraC-like DNA-binding protein|nr:AraC family transcriptional regulator [Muribaculaceae bacterium]
MSKIITEITPLSEKDCFYLIDRYKDCFTYPIHKHEEYELNFVENCKGARRIVGDSMEDLGEYDLALVGPNLEHVWEQYECRGKKIREITIQFSKGLLGDTFLGKNQLDTIKKLLDNAKNGIAFEMPAIMKVYGALDEITHTQPGFYRVIKFLTIIYELSVTKSQHVLSSSSFAHSDMSADSRRVQKIEEYINRNYSGEVRLQTLSEMVGMTPTAFSRFFKLRTGRTISDYLIDIRLGYAARKLADSTMSILEVCYDCGFNNVSNFNRIFKKKKGCSPKVFRENYHKNKILV